MDTRLILHQLPLPRKSLKRGKDILVSTSWWEVASHIRYGIRFTVRILGGITHYPSLIPLTLERSKETGFPWSIPPDLARLTPSDRYPTRPMILTLCSPSSGDLAHAAWFFPDHRQKIFRILPITGNKYFVLYLRQPGFPDQRQGV